MRAQGCGRSGMAGRRRFLLAGGPPELPVQEFSCGETVYDREARLLKRPAEAVCQAYLCAAEQPGGIFTDFELRGGIKA